MNVSELKLSPVLHFRNLYWKSWTKNFIFPGCQVSALITFYWTYIFEFKKFYVQKSEFKVQCMFTKKLSNRKLFLSTKSCYRLQEEIFGKFLFWKILNYSHNYHKHEGNSQWFSWAQFLLLFWRIQVSPRKQIHSCELMLIFESMSACASWISFGGVFFQQCWAFFLRLCWVR